ncbi:MAG: 4Fe-4S binding protein [Clostridia bacterium]|nr:4Fe-4S binding protein [Clostridia bacterium]
MDKKKRFALQSLAVLLHNADLKGFFTGRISATPAKTLCVPGLNCYSCPAATGACPIGSLQSALGAYKFRFPYYVLGLLIFFGAVAGRFICGFLCPFGFLQDLLYKIPFFKKIKTFRGDRYLRLIKYIVLIVLVIVLPLCVKLTPFFCKYLCPSGTLAGILLAFSDTRLFDLFGSMFAWKACILGITLLAGIFIFRPFCKYLCPLGAFYSLFNRVSVFKMDVDKSACIGCSACAGTCKMGVNPSLNPNSLECIRCGECVNVCPCGALKYTTAFNKKPAVKGERNSVE